MGVLKNGVGRPSNETIKKRNIFKVTTLVLSVGIIGLTAYILNDKGIIKVNNENATKEVKNLSKKEIDNYYNKYKDLEFVRTTKLDDLNYSYQDNSGSLDSYEIKLNIEDGILKATSKDKDITVSDMGSKVRYITPYEPSYYGVDGNAIAILTEDNKVYIGDAILINNKLKYEFYLISENIVDMYQASNENGDNVQTDFQTLYLLDSNGNLRRVVTYYDNYLPIYSKTKLSDELYEDRIVYLGNYHQGWPWQNLMVDEKDNSVSFYKISTEDNLYKISDYEAIKYNNVKISAKEVFIYYDNDEKSSSTSAFIIDKNNNIYTTEKVMLTSYYDSIPDECYKIKLHSDEKVKSTNVINYTEDYTEKSKIEITYESGKTESFELFDHHKYDEYK